MDLGLWTISYSGGLELSKGYYPKTDCRHFDGYKPCQFHKRLKVRCTDECPKYSKIGRRILVIKTGAAGEVLRNTPILVPIRKKDPDAEIVWITQFPDLVPKSQVDKILPYNWETAESLQSQNFDVIYSLDKAVSECALAMKIPAGEIKGFVLDRNGRIVPANDNAYNKWITGVDDEAMSQNVKHYVEETFDVCGFKYQGERYQMDKPEPWKGAILNDRPIVGINTGAGPRWVTRIWPEDYYLKLVSHLQYLGVEVVVLGGPDEHERNKRIAFQSGAKYFGIQSIPKFISLINECDLVFSSVTMAMHIAIGLGKKVVAINNIFPTNEFYFYGNGKILEPNLICKGCYKSVYDDNCIVKNCISLIKPEDVLKEIQCQLGYQGPSTTLYETVQTLN